MLLYMLGAYATLRIEGNVARGPENQFAGRFEDNAWVVS